MLRTQGHSGGGHPAGINEKRSAPRVSLEALLAYTHLDEQQRPAEMGMGKVVDLGPGGVRIQLHKPFSVHTELDLALAIEEQIVSARSRIIHTRRLGETLYEMGVVFLQVDEGDRKVLSRVL